MFDSICLGRPGQPVTAGLGLLAECLLYYRRVHFVVNHQGFKSLIRVCGPDTLLRLVDDGHLDIVYQENRLGVATNNAAGVEQHGFVVFEGVGYSAQDYVPKVLQETVGKSGKGRRLGNRICQRLSKRKYDPANAPEWLADIENTDYTNTVASKLLEILAPGYRNPGNTLFRVHSDQGKYFVETNIDFQAANEIYGRANPNSSLNPALILSYLYEGTANLLLAGDLASELVAAPFESVLAVNRVQRLIDRSNRTSEGIKRFHEYTLPSKSISEAIDTGRKNFDDLRRLLDKAAKFREWLHDRPADGDLLREYVIACSRLAWIDKLPSRALRYVLFNSTGLVGGAALGGVPGVVASLTASAVDSFLLERLASGWKPSHFIGGSLARFLNE